MSYSFERHINAFLWLSLISVTIFLLRELAKVFELWIKARHIPGPPCTSIYGHCRLISQSNFTDLISKSHEKYGPVVKLWSRPTQLLVSIKDKELIKEVLLKAEDKLPLTGRANYLGFGRSSLFISSFDKVEDRRKSLEVVLNESLLERGSSVPAKVVKSVLERVQTLMVDRGLDCETISQHLSFTIMGATLFGDVFLTWSKASVYIELLMKIAKDAYFLASYGVTHYWKQEFWTYQHLCTELKCLTQELIGQCRQKYESDSFERDFDGNHDMSHEPCAEIISMMFHGSLTMATIIGNILTRLVTHPEIQHKIHSEIIMVRKISQRHDQQGVGGLPFLLATVYESARLLPAGLFLQRCSFKHDLNLNNGMIIPAGAIFVVPIQLVQKDVSSWGNDASKFNPHRFLSRIEERCDADQKKSLAGDSSYIVKDPSENEAFLPFGSGIRACLGGKIAILEISTLFVSLLEQYEVRLQTGSERNPKSMVNNCVPRLLPNPKISFVKRQN